MAENGSKTILLRCFTESIKKHTEDIRAHRKHRHSEGNGYSLKSDGQETLVVSKQT